MKSLGHGFSLALGIKVLLKRHCMVMLRLLSRRYWLRYRPSRDVMPLWRHVARNVGTYVEQSGANTFLTHQTVDVLRTSKLPTEATDPSYSNRLVSQRHRHWKVEPTWCQILVGNCIYQSASASLIVWRHMGSSVTWTKDVDDTREDDGADNETVDTAT